jgi:hypothetical protein
MTDPTSPSEVNALYDRRWQDLQHLSSMIDHWYWRPGWHVGRSFYTWHITFEHAPEVQDLAAFYQNEIRLPTLDPVPSEGLHLTMQGVGFADEVSPQDLKAIETAARERCRADRGRKSESTQQPPHGF